MIPVSGKPVRLITILLTGLLLTGSLCGQVTLDPSLGNPAPQPQQQPTPGPAMQPPAPLPPPNPLIADAEDIRDIRDPVHIPNPWIPYIIAASVIAGIILIFLLVRYIIRKIKEKPATPPISPYDQALQELTATRAFIEDGEDKEFSIAVSNVVRYFLERQFKMPAPECTTEEFLYQIQDHELIKGPLAEEFSTFLSMCDMAKFARQTHGREGMEKLYNQAEKLIEETYVKHKMQMRLLADAARGKGLDKPAVETAPQS